LKESASEVVDGGLADREIVLDPDSSETAEGIYEFPVHERTGAGTAELVQERLDEVTAGLDREDLAGLDAARVSEERILGAGLDPSTADIVGLEPERVSEAVREKLASDALGHQFGSGAAGDSDLAQNLGEERMRAVV
jgi:hypothetical protein